MRTWRTFSRLIEGSRHIALWSLGLSVAQSMALVPIALLVRNAFDEAIPAEDSGRLILIGAGILALYVLSLALGLLGRYVVLRVTKPAIAHVRSELIEHVIWLPSTYYDSTDTGRLHSLIVQDTERLDTMAKYLLAVVIPSVGTAAILLASLVVIQPILLAVLLVTIPLLVLLSRLLRGMLRERVRIWQEASDSFSASVLASLRSAALIKVRTAEEQAIAEGAGRSADLAAAGQEIGWLQQAYGLTQVALGGVAGVIVLIGGGLSVLHGSMSIGDLIAFMAILALARGQLNWVSAALPDILTGLAAIERIDEVLATDEREPYQGGRAVELKGALSWDAVTFGYTREEPPVLDSVSLGVEAGETLAILGPTGAGKTTLVALLLGLYRPWSGTVRVDGTPLEEIDIRELRRQSGALLQEGAALRGTVAQNIAFGRPEATAEQIQRAARMAAAEDFVRELPDGYETEIGDEGVRLSAGQRQRIALARALLGRAEGRDARRADQPPRPRDRRPRPRQPHRHRVASDPASDHPRPARRPPGGPPGRSQGRPGREPHIRDGRTSLSAQRAAVWMPDRDQLALLRASLWTGERALDAWGEWRRAEPDLDVIEKGSYRLLPLLYRNLGPQLADDPDIGRLKGIYRRSWTVNQIGLRIGRQGIDALRGAGLDVVALKGAALLDSAYHDRGARPMGDVDLAVPEEHIPEAVQRPPGRRLQHPTRRTPRAFSRCATRSPFAMPRGRRSTCTGGCSGCPGWTGTSGRDRSRARSPARPCASSTRPIS